MSKRRNLYELALPGNERNKVEAPWFQSDARLSISRTWGGPPARHKIGLRTCTDKNRRPKKAYRTMGEAEAIRDHEQRRCRGTLRVYACDACGHWHLTSTPRR